MGAARRILIYGDGGVGKTTFCASCPGVYFLPTEEGANQIRVPQWKKRITSLDELNLAIELLTESDHGYKAICIDTLDAVEGLIEASVDAKLSKNTKGAKSLAEANEDYGAGYELVSDAWKSLLKNLDIIRESGIHILMTAHTKSERVRNLEGYDYEKHSLHIAGKKSKKLIIEWCDYVLFARRDVLVSKESRNKVLGITGDRSIYTTPTASYDAKARGETPWPERIPLDWETFNTTATLISERGKELPSSLLQDGNILIPKIPSNDSASAEDRRKKATELLDQFVRERNYASAYNILKMIKAETEKANGAIQSESSNYAQGNT